MASTKAVVTALAMFSETFPGKELTERTATVWETVLADVDDAALGRAVLRLCRDPERRFFPSSGEVFAAIAADASPVDVLTIIHRIEKLGHYDPSRGWVYPNYEMIRDNLGDEIAKAYSVAGAQNIFADEAKDGTTVTRDIARRAFSSHLERVNKATPERLRLSPPERQVMPAVELPRPRAPRLLGPGDKTPLAEIVAKVTADITVESGQESAA